MQSPLYALPALVFAVLIAMSQIGQRVCPNFNAQNRVFLAGDAVHTHSPKGKYSELSGFFGERPGEWDMQPHVILFYMST